MIEPQGVRPHFPEGYLLEPKALLPWSHVEERMVSAKNYWLCTVRQDGRPHAIPLWAVWVDGYLYFDGSPETRHARNLAANPNAAVHLESGDDVIILEGAVEMLASTPIELGQKLAPAYCQKYAHLGYSPEPDQWKDGGLFCMRPSVVFAWTSFTDDPTKFVLTPAA